MILCVRLREPTLVIVLSGGCQPAADSQDPMPNQRFRTVLLALTLVAPACDKTAESAKAETKAADKAAPEKDPKELFAAKIPELPAPLAKLDFGMTAEEAAKAAPEITKGYAKSKEYKGTYVGYYVPKDSNKLMSMRVVVEAEGADVEKILTAAWGEPKRGTELENPKLFWFNPDKGIRATVSKGYGKEKEVQFDAYLPAKSLLGEGKDKLGFETSRLLGATPDDLKKNYAKYLEELTKERAEQQRADLEKFAGKKLEVLGEASASTHLDLLPTEYGSSFTRVNPTLEGGKIVRFRVGLDYKPFPPAKEELFAMLKAKWGEPKEQEDLGRKQWLFNAAAPRVVVENDDISKKWDIEVSP